jgi:putative membrane-bound dehydrogenase-like protein
MRALIFLSLAVSLSADEFPKPFNTGTDVGKKPISADEAVKLIKMPDGFKATVFAAEPDVQNPIACAWDSRGRLWVAENYSYAEAAVGFDKRLRDRIVIFEDTDNDGKHDKRTVFADNLFNLTSIELGYGGVFCTAAPYLLWIPDEDGDDKPDAPKDERDSKDKRDASLSSYKSFPSLPGTSTRILLDGFDDKSVRHNFVNGLRWGPDGWLYGRHGILATSKVGKPGTPDAERLPINVGIWRWHPTRHTVEMVTYGGTNPWGLDFNAEGEGFFTNTVTGHLYHMIPGAHYERMYGEDPNPYIYQLLPQTADHYHYDRSQSWTASRDGKANDFGGGHAHVGCMIYQGENWPEQYRGKLFTINLHGRRINVNRLERKGSGYVGKSEPDMIFFGDPWFRGNELTYGPDGGVYVLDWSDQGECHENDGVHRESGRIYKITYGEVKKNAVAENAPSALKDALAGIGDKGDFAELSNKELVIGMIEGSEWLSRIAKRLLSERASSGHEGAGVISTLITEAYNSGSLINRQRAIFALHSINMGASKVFSALISGSPYVITGRGASVRAWFHERLLFGPNEERKIIVRLIPEWWQGDPIEDISKATDDILNNRVSVKTRTNNSDIALGIGAFVGLATFGEPQSALAIASSIRHLPQKVRWLVLSGFDAKPDQVDSLVKSVAWAGLMAPNRFPAIDDFKNSRVQPMLAALQVETSHLPEIVAYCARFVAESSLVQRGGESGQAGDAMGVVLSGAIKAGNESTVAAVTNALAVSFKGAHKVAQPKNWPAFAKAIAKATTTPARG